MSPVRATWRKDPDTGLYRRAWYDGRPGYIEPGACEPCCGGDPPPECPECCGLDLSHPDWCGASNPVCSSSVCGVIPGPGTGCCGTCRRLSVQDPVRVRVFAQANFSVTVCCQNGQFEQLEPQTRTLDEEVDLDLPSSGCTSSSRPCAGTRPYSAVSGSGSWSGFCGGNCGALGITGVVRSVLFSASSSTIASCNANNGINNSGNCSTFESIDVTNTNQDRECGPTVCWSRTTVTRTLRVQTLSNMVPCPGAPRSSPTVIETSAPPSQGGGCGGCGSGDAAIFTGDPGSLRNRLRGPEAEARASALPGRGRR